MISRPAEENGREVFWHPLKFIAVYAARMEYRSCSAVAFSTILFLLAFFLASLNNPSRPSIPRFVASTFPLLSASLRRLVFRFLADLANLCIAYPLLSPPSTFSIPRTAPQLRQHAATINIPATSSLLISDKMRFFRGRKNNFFLFNAEANRKHDGGDLRTSPDFISETAYRNLNGR